MLCDWTCLSWLFTGGTSRCRGSASENRPMALVSQEAIVAACGEAAHHLKPYQVLSGSQVFVQAKFMKC